MNILRNHPLYFQNPAFVLQDVICVFEFLVMFSLTQISSALVCASVAGHKSWSLQCLINELRSGRHFFNLTKLADFTAVCVLVSLLLLKRLFPSPDGPEITLTMGSFSVFSFPFCGFFFSQKLDGSQEVVAWKTGSSEPLVDASSRTGSDVPLWLSRENILLDLLAGDLFKYAGLYCVSVCLGPSALSLSSCCYNH